MFIVALHELSLNILMEIPRGLLIILSLFSKLKEEEKQEDVSRRNGYNDGIYDMEIKQIWIVIRAQTHMMDTYYIPKDENREERLINWNEISKTLKYAKIKDNQRYVKRKW
eukprot:264841_1